jgi:hypothetical protein
LGRAQEVSRRLLFPVWRVRFTKCIKKMIPPNESLPDSRSGRLKGKLPMTKKKRLLLVGVVGGFCVLAAGGLRSCILSVVSPKPWKLGGVFISEKQMTITLWAGSRQEAFIQPYDGVHRILEVSQRDMPTKYYDLPSTITEEGCQMEVFWYPTSNLVRLKDRGFGFAREFRSECLLDLNQHVMFAVLRGSGVTHIAQLSIPRDDLAFPESHVEERVASSYVGKVSNLSPTSSETVTIGRHNSQPVMAAWTTNSGVLIGVIPDKHQD